MAKIDIVILNMNQGLLDITKKSIERNMPGWIYHVINVPVKTKTLFYTYNLSKKLKKPILAVEEGMILDIKEDDIPEKIEEYPLVVSREAVFIRDNRIHSDYNEIDADVGGRIDLSVFIMNHEKFDFHPMKNRGVLSKLRLGYMPRGMNFKSDILFKKTMNPYNCLKYGVESSNASIINYTDLLYQSELKMNELLAYDFMHFQPYLNDFKNKRLRTNLMIHIAKTRKNSIHKLRRRMRQVVPSRFGSPW